MKLVKLGSFNGYNLLLEDKDEVYSEPQWNKKFQDYLKSIKEIAVRDYKSSLFINKLKSKFF